MHLPDFTEITEVAEVIRLRTSIDGVLLGVQETAVSTHLDTGILSVGIRNRRVNTSTEIIGLAAMVWWREMRIQP